MEFVRPHTQTIYDLAGNVLKLIDPNGNATVNTYDSLGRLKTTKTNPTVVASNTPHADDIVVQNEYDAGSNLVQVTDGLGQATRFTFDGLKRSTSTIWDYGTTRAKTLITEYDALVTTAAVDSRNWRTEFSYDERFRQVASTCASRPDDNETRSYDLADRLRSVNRASSTDLRNVSYLYDDAGRTTQETSTGQTTISEYDESGNRRCVTYPLGGRQLVTSFDALNRVTTIVETKPGVTGSRTTSYFYDASGNRVLCTKPHGGSETTSYDALSRKVSLTTNSGIASTISSTIYIYDLGSNLISISEANNAVPDRSIENIYDRVYRLKQETTVTGANDKTEVAAFTYDKANNRTGRTRTTVVPGSPTTVYSDTFTYGSAANGGNSNQLMLFHDGKRFVDVSYTYDANGNRQQRLEGSSATHTYVWDNRNRLIEVTSPDGTSHYGYDYRTRRVLRDESSAGGTSDVITFSGGTSIFERVINTTVPTVEYIRGSDWGGGIGGILYTERGGDITHNAYNSRGDVIAKTNSQGTITWQASYEAFGTRTEETGTNADRQRANTKEEDPTGLLNEGFRYRDLETGLFISRDPAGFVDGPNVYTYVRQNPWSAFDPDGLKTIEDYEKKIASLEKTAAEKDARAYARGLKGLQWGAASGWRERWRIRDAREAIDGIVKTAQSIKDYTGVEVEASSLNDEWKDYKSLSSINYWNGFNPEKQVGDDLAKGNYKDAGIHFTRDVVIGAITQAAGGAFIRSFSTEGSLAARGAVTTEVQAAKSEVTVYRVFGGDARAQGFSWTTAHPESVSNFRNLAGLPSGGASGGTNTAEFMIQGRASVGDIIKSRSALPLDGNVGGLPELIIDPKNVKMTDFSVIKP